MNDASLINTNENDEGCQTELVLAALRRTLKLQLQCELNHAIAIRCGRRAVVG